MKTQQPTTKTIESGSTPLIIRLIVYLFLSWPIFSIVNCALSDTPPKPTPVDTRTKIEREIDAAEVIAKTYIISSMLRPNKASLDTVYKGMDNDGKSKDTINVAFNVTAINAFGDEVRSCQGMKFKKNKKSSTGYKVSSYKCVYK